MSSFKSTSLYLYCNHICYHHLLTFTSNNFFVNHVSNWAGCSTRVSVCCPLLSASSHKQELAAKTATWSTVCDLPQPTGFSSVYLSLLFLYLTSVVHVFISLQNSLFLNALLIVHFQQRQFREPITWIPSPRIAWESEGNSEFWIKIPYFAHKKQYACLRWFWTW